MPWEIHWPKVKRRRSLPILSLTTIPNPHQSSHVQFLPPVEEHPSFRQPFSHMLRKPVPSSGPSPPPEVTHLNIQKTNIAPARILFQTDTYIISSLPGKDPQDVLDRIRQDGIPYNSTYGQNLCCQHEDAIRYHQRLSPVLSAHDASADDDLPEIDIQLPPVRRSTPLGFGKYEFPCDDSSNSSMVPYLQFHPDTPIGGYEAAPTRNTGPTEKRYKTPRIKFFSPENHHKARKERHSSSTYNPPNYPLLLDGNNSRTQSQAFCTLGQYQTKTSAPESCYAPECITKTTPKPPSTEAQESCYAPECVGKPFPSGAPTQIEKWIFETNYRTCSGARIPSIDGTNTPPNPLTSISNPPRTSIRHSQSAPTAPLPIPIENTVENPEPPTPGNYSKVKDSLRDKRGQKSRNGLRKFRKFIFRKGLLKIVLGRQLAQPTADLLDMMAKGIEFEAPDMKALAQPPVPTGPVPL